MNELIHLQMKTKENFYHARMVIYVYATPENKYYELPNPRPIQRKNSFRLPESGEKVTKSLPNPTQNNLI